MNRHLTSFLLALALVVQACPVAGQDQAGLAPGFEKLSAKERTRIAKEEEEKARQDSVYQGVMRRAEEAFQQQRYEEALDLFKQARVLRPYNVYPKVKIQDLQTLLGRKEDGTIATPEPVPVREPEPSDQQPVPMPLVIHQVPVEPPKVIQPEKPAPAPVRPAAPVVRQEDPAPAPAQPGERWYREGQAVVLERTVLEEGRAITYRRVTHPWGQVFHFREGLTVEERVWRSRFGD
ncbi:MAG: tetratricopeptide repeat protein [Flavobacteriales bacterium]|nr:tetratricopeptide repeat protein [Flavobacteriales bacterium]